MVIIFNGKIWLFLSWSASVYVLSFEQMENWVKMCFFLFASNSVFMPQNFDDEIAIFRMDTWQNTFDEDDDDVSYIVYSAGEANKRTMYIWI